MSLQFIMGPSGAGKSHYLYQWVTTESLRNPEKNYIVLVPEQFTLQTQKDLCLVSPRKGILNIEVLSFNRLAHRVFEEVGENRRMVLDDVGKNFVIRKVAGDREEDLKILRSNLKKAGYISEIKSIISEFTQYDISPDTLNDLLEKVKHNPKVYYKLRDIQTVYGGFREYLKEKYITEEETLDVLAVVAEKSKLLKDSVIVLDGFTGFTPVQNKLLRELMTVCEKLVVTVTIDEKENPYVYHHPYQLFALSKKMVTGLVGLAKENGVPIADAICLYQKPVYRFRDNEALAFLESHLFRYTKEQYGKEQDSVQVWCAKNPKEEIDFIAQKIRHMVRTKQYRYQDFAILTSELSAYSNQIEQVFAKYDLPVFMDDKRSILLNACVEYIRSLLAMAEQNFTYDTVFRYLRTGLSPLPTSEVDLLQNYVLAMGIKGYKKWQETWIRRSKGMEESELSQINRIRKQFIDSVETVMAVLKSRRKTVLDVTTALHDFFLKEELQKHVKEYQLMFETQGELALEKEYAQAYRIVIEVLNQFVELLGDEYISLKEYCELLDAGLEQAKVGIIPPSVDQIIVGDVERSRIKDVKVVFLVGTNDVYIPGAVTSGGLLSEHDREKMIDMGATLAPGAKEKTYIQKFYLYLILTKPKHQIYLTYSKTSGDGSAIRPSYLVSELLKIFPRMKVRTVSEELHEKELTVESGLDSLVRGMQRKHRGLSKEWQELYTWYKKHPKYCKKIEQIVEANFYQKPESVLTRQTARKIYGDILVNSVTRLEKFSACAYAHFLTYGLRLKEREEYQFQAVDLGNLCHSSLEKFSKKLERAGYGWNNIPQDVTEEFIRESVDESIVDYGNSILYSSARNEYIITRLKRMLRRTIWALQKQLEKGDFKPKGYEVSFGGVRELSTSHIQLDDLGKMVLRGKIDRIDTYEDDEHIYVKIIDYKTGEKTLDLGELCYGLQMQLVVYMNAAMEMSRQDSGGKQVIPAGLFYYRVKDPLVDKVEDETILEDSFLNALRPDGLVMNSPAVIDHMDRDVEQASKVIPVSKNKDGSLAKKSKALTEEDFEIISEFTNRQVRKVGKQILKGEAGISPYKIDQKTGCDYCPYQAICGFDEKMEGYAYRQFEKLEAEEAMEIMREEAAKWE